MMFSVETQRGFQKPQETKNSSALTWWSQAKHTLTPCTSVETAAGEWPMRPMRPMQWDVTRNAGVLQVVLHAESQALNYKLRWCISFWFMAGSVDIFAIFYTIFWYFQVSSKFINSSKFSQHQMEGIYNNIVSEQHLTTGVESNQKRSGFSTLSELWPGVQAKPRKFNRPGHLETLSETGWKRIGEGTGAATSTYATQPEHMCSQDTSSSDSSDSDHKY